MNRFETKHKVILIVSLSHSASTGVQELFVNMLGTHESDLTLPPFDLSWYSNIGIYHQDVYTGLKKIKPYQNINWGENIRESDFIEIINAPIETEYFLHRFHIDQIDNRGWVYELLENPPDDWIILVPVRHPYLTLLRKYNDKDLIPSGPLMDINIWGILLRLYSLIDGDRVIPVPIDLLSTLPKDILKKELQFFFDYYFGIEYESNLEDRIDWISFHQIFYQRLNKQKNKKSELVMIEEVWDLSEPIIGILKRIGINYTDDLNNYNKFSFRNYE